MGSPEFEYEVYVECNDGNKVFLLGATRKSGVRSEYVIAKRDKNSSFTEQIRNNQANAKIK